MQKQKSKSKSKPKSKRETKVKIDDAKIQGRFRELRRQGLSMNAAGNALAKEFGVSQTTALVHADPQFARRLKVWRRKHDRARVVSLSQKKVSIKRARARAVALVAGRAAGRIAGRIAAPIGEYVVGPTPKHGPLSDGLSGRTRERFLSRDVGTIHVSVDMGSNGKQTCFLVAGVNPRVLLRRIRGTLADLTDLHRKPRWLQPRK